MKWTDTANKKSKSYLDGDTAVEHIKNEVSKVYHTKKKGHILVTCPYHSDIFPAYSKSRHKLAINLDPNKTTAEGKKLRVGYFRCWVCEASGHFNKLTNDPELTSSRRYKFKPLPETDAADASVLDDILYVNYEEKDTLVNFHRRLLTEWSDKWRGLGKKFLKKMGAFNYFFVPEDYVNESGEKKIGIAEDRLFFFCYDVNEQIIGYVHLANDEGRELGSLKQRNMDGPWVKNTLMFYEKVPNNKCIVVVEGPYDALRLWKHGINAVAILGNNWSKAKRNLIVSKASSVIVLTDGDDFGRKMGAKIEEDLSEYLPVKFMKLRLIKDKNKEKLDPGNMPEHYIDKLKQTISKMEEKHG